MAGFLTPEAQAILDLRYPAGATTDYYAWSVNGTSEFAGLARTAVGSWAAATAADPSVKANAGAVLSAAATSAGTVTHFAVMTASTGGTQRIDWTALTTARTLAVDDQLSGASGALGFTLT